MSISDDTAKGLGTSVVRLVKLYSAMRQHAPKVHPGADVSAYPILFFLAQGPRRVSALADCVHSDVSTISRQVSALATHGLVDKLADPQDGRASQLTLTPDGHQVIEALQQQRTQWFQTMLDDWDPVDVERLGVLLERFADAVEGSKDGLLAMRPGTAGG